jgi:hypothetical protein
MLRRLFVCILVLSIAACAQGPVSVPTSLQGVKPGTGGLVFGSIGTSGDGRLSSFSLRFRAVGSKEEGQFTYRMNPIHAMDDRADFNDETKGAVFSVRLPPGDYQLFNMRLYESHGQYGDVTFTSKEDFPITFSVKEGKAVYLGEYLVHRLSGKNIFFLPATAGGYFVVSDKLDRDLAVVEKRGETVPRDSIENMVSPILAADVPAFRREALPDN